MKQEQQQRQLQVKQSSYSPVKFKDPYRILKQQTKKSHRHQKNKITQNSILQQVPQSVENVFKFQFPLTNQKIASLHHKKPHEEPSQSNKKCYEDRFTKKALQYKQYKKAVGVSSNKHTQAKQIQKMQKSFLSANPIFDLRFINDHIHTQSATYSQSYQQNVAFPNLQSNLYHIHSEQNLSKQQVTIKKLLPNLDLKLFKSKSIRNSLNSIYNQLNLKRNVDASRKAIVSARQEQKGIATQKTIRNKFFGQQNQKSEIQVPSIEKVAKTARCPPCPPCPTVIKMKRNASNRHCFEDNINPENKSKEILTNRLTKLEKYDRQAYLPNRRSGLKQEVSPLVIKKYGKWYLQQ